MPPALPAVARAGEREARDVQILRWLALLALVFLLPAAKPFLLPVVLAVLLSIVLAGPVRALQRRGISEPVGALIVVGAVVALVALLLTALAQPAHEWLRRLPSNMEQFSRAIDRLREAIPLLRVQGHAGPGDTQSTLSETIATQGWTITRVVLDQASSLAVATVSTFLLLYFILASEHWFVIRIMQHVPGRRARLHWLAMGRSIQREVAHYLGTMTLINVLLGTATALALWWIGLPNPLLWGAIVAVLNYVPYLGPLVIGTLLFAAGVLAFDDFGLMVAPPLAFFGLNVIEAYVVTPLVQGRRLDLNPVFVFLSVMFWGWVWGIAGALVAVPLLVALRNGMRHSRRWRHVSYWLEQPAATTKTIRGMVREPRVPWGQRFRWRERAAAPAVTTPVASPDVAPPLAASTAAGAGFAATPAPPQAAPTTLAAPTPPPASTTAVTFAPTTHADTALTR
jgi:flagellin-like protein